MTTTTTTNTVAAIAAVLAAHRLVPGGSVPAGQSALRVRALDLESP